MVEKEKPKPFDYNGLIDDLIQKIDNEKTLFTKKDELHGYGNTFVIIGAYMLILSAVLILAVGSVIQNITFAIATGAFIVTFVYHKSEDMKDNAVEANFEKAIKSFKIEKKEDKKRMILEALLKIKAKNPIYKLATAKEINPELFTKEKLLEKLYE